MNEKLESGPRPDERARRRLKLLEAIRAAGIRDERVLQAIESVDRAQFIPPGESQRAYRDHPIAIGHGQVTTQPSLVARMVEALRLTGRERVLEVGTGLGYQAAVLSRVCREVFSVERFDDFVAGARDNLRAAEIGNARVLRGDGSLGLAEFAPFDAIIVAAAAPKVPPPLTEQLAEGGRLVQPVGFGGEERVNRYRKKEGRLEFEEQLTPASFVRLIGAHGVSASD